MSFLLRYFILHMNNEDHPDPQLSNIRCDSLELNNLWDGNNIPLSVRHAERFKTFTFNQVPVTPL